MLRTIVAAAFGCAALSATPARALDAPVAGRNAPAMQVGSAAASLPADATARLKSGDPQAIEAALGDVRVAGRAGAAAVPPIVDLLRHGLSQPLTLAAIETLGDVASESGSEVIAWYTRHRNVELRRSAVGALAKTGGAAAVRALRLALSDADPAVRGLAASALGGLKAKETVADLFAALEHNVPEAAASIGEVCSAGECEKLASLLGVLPFDVVTSGLQEVLLRPPSDVSDDVKVSVVARLRALQTAEANRFLRAVQARYPARASQRVKRAIDEAISETNGSPGSKGDALP
jgi:HEAT repeat protein